MSDIVKDVCRAVDAVKLSQAKRVDVARGVTVYKVPSNNPEKFVIRIDLKIDNSK